MPEFCVGNLVASDRDVRLLFGRHDQFSKSSEGATGAYEEMRRKQRSARLAFETPGNFFVELNEALLKFDAVSPTPDSTSFRKPHCSKRCRKNRFHEGSGGEDNFCAAASDVSNNNIFSMQVKGMLHAGEGKSSLSLSRYNLNIEPNVLLYSFTELRTVCGFSNSACSNRTQC